MIRAQMSRSKHKHAVTGRVFEQPISTLLEELEIAHPRQQPTKARVLMSRGLRRRWRWRQVHLQPFQPLRTAHIHPQRRWPWKPAPVPVTRLLVPTLSGEHLDHTVAAATHDPPRVLAPHHRAHAFAAHDPVGGDFLGAAALFERPEAEGGVVPC